MRKLPVLQGAGARPVAAARPDPDVRGEAPLAWLERGFLYADRAIERVVPASANPLAHTGAIANVTFAIAVVTGCLLLIWYSSSVHEAHASLEAMRGSFLASLVRSLHRYSSDGCLLFVLVHALRLTAARRVTGARWVAWVTGIVLVSSLWLVGWLGYWLVWDEPAKRVAVASAKVVDVLPIFAEPFERSFLTDASVPSLLFFVVFFVHMLLPLGMGIALWLHVTRLSRARLFTSRPLTIAIVVSLVIVSALWPATSGPPARMTAGASDAPIDLLYLFPLAIAERASGGALWAIGLLLGAVIVGVPWSLGRGRAAPVVLDRARCNGCSLCHADCPYDAITMVPREDARTRKTTLQAQIDPSKCVGCGICIGSCDPGALSIPGLEPVEARARMDRYREDALRDGDAAVAFACARSAAADLKVDPKSGACDALPGYRVLPVACVGAVHMLTVERALRHGASHVLLVGCGHSEPAFREGVRWTEQRLAGARRPALRSNVDPERVRFVALDRSQRDELLREAGATRARPAPKKPSRVVHALAGAALAAIVAVPVVSSSRVAGLVTPAGPELVVSFKHPGRVASECRKLSEAEKAALPPHMRRDEICDRTRPPVRLRVTVDGAVAIESSHRPHGLRGDGPSVAIERLALSPGRHHVTVAIGETADAGEWTFRDERTIEVPGAGRVVVLFDRVTGFTWEGGSQATSTIVSRAAP